MRFIKSTHHPFTDTARKRAALVRKQKAEREAMPLFAAEIAAGQRSPDDVMQARAVSWAVSQARRRQWRAERWRQARREIDAMPKNMRRKVRAAWDGAPYPADPVYLLDFLHELRVGRRSMDALPFTPKPVNARGHSIGIGGLP
ncbi:hypothetical protein FNJ84_20845 [Paracoccus sp. M683]|uniref:hypothetical protein n=1 Tax=Paracoccus sp. M683 TaxID=2594268 RepID=UPI00117F27FB|nr:hypothetical protein [Paracoccus sp. M683]TRW92854.1 hypothetical protein FNJ84_20845 [Paracoccus sp. M683]